MTEQTYLTSTDPRALYDFCWERMTERQCEMFVQACRQMTRDTGYAEGPPLSDTWRARARGWCLDDREGLWPWRADIFRDIVGPFRPAYQCNRCEGDGKAHGADRPFEAGPNQPYPSPCPVCKGSGHTDEHAGLLTWRDGTIPKLAAKCYEGEECNGCNGHGGFDFPDECRTCYGSGTITPTILDPFKLALLADALEECGCEDQGLLGHLRKTEEKCLNCDGSGEVHSHNPKCWECKGLGSHPIQHVRGCWAVELFLPIEITK